MNIILPKLTLSFDEDDLEKTVELSTIQHILNNIYNKVGIPEVKLHTVKITVPNFTNVITATFSLIDGDSDTEYSISALGKNTINYLFVDRIINVENYILKITLSGAAGGTGGNVVLQLKVEV